MMVELSSNMVRSWWSSTDRTMIIEPDCREIDNLIMDLNQRIHSGSFSNTSRGFEVVIEEISRIHNIIKLARIKPEFC
jgi:hypothetical protein